MVLLNDLGQVTHMNILVLGDKHTGKSSLISTFINPKNALTCKKELYSPTIEDSITVQHVVNIYRNDITNSYLTGGNPFSSINTLASSSLFVSNHTESLQEALNSRSILKDSALDLESILSEISSNMDGSSCEFSVDTINEVSDDQSVSQSIFMERSEKEKIESIQTINLTITEVGGAIEFVSLIPSAIDKADAFILVYDVGNEESFHHIWNYFKKVVETKMEKPKNIPMILVGSMVDTIVKHLSNSRSREVTTEQGRLFAKLTNIPFFESSAKAPKVVSSCFRKLIGEAQRIYMDYFENVFVKQQRQQLQQQELNEIESKQSCPLPPLPITEKIETSEVIEESTKTSSSVTQLNSNKELKSFDTNTDTKTNIIDDTKNTSNINNDININTNDNTNTNTTINTNTNTNININDNTNVNTSINSINTNTNTSTNNPIIIPPPSNTNNSLGVSIPLQSAQTSLSVQQQLLISSLQPQPVSLPSKHPSSNSIESSLSSNSTLLNHKNNDMNTLSPQIDMMTNNNNSGNTLQNEIMTTLDLNSQDPQIQAINNVINNSTLYRNKRSSKLMNLSNNNGNNNKRLSNCSSLTDNENRIKSLLSSPSRPLQNINSNSSFLLHNNTINSSRSSIVSSSNSHSSNQLLQTGTMDGAQQSSIHSSIERNSSGSSYQSSQSSNQKNIINNKSNNNNNNNLFNNSNQFMYLPQNISNTLNINNDSKDSISSMKPNTTIRTSSLSKKRLSKNSLSDTTTTESLISALSAMTLGDSNSVPTQTKTETLAFLKNFIITQENELASSNINLNNDTRINTIVNNNSNNTIDSKDSIDSSNINIQNTLNNHTLASFIQQPQSYSDNCPKISNKQSINANRKHFSDNSGILSNQLRHISSLSDLELLREKNLSQDQFLKDICSSNSDVNTNKNLQIEEEKLNNHLPPNPIFSNINPLLNNNSPLSPALSDATVTSNSSLSSSSNNINNLNRKRNSSLYNNILNMKQQHYQQNNYHIKPAYYHNLSNILEDTEMNKPIDSSNVVNNNNGLTDSNSYMNPQGILPNNDNNAIGLQTNSANILLQQQQQQQHHGLKNSISTPNMRLHSNNNIIMNNNINNNNSNSNIYNPLLNYNNNFNLPFNFDTINSSNTNLSSPPSLNRMNQNPLNQNPMNQNPMNQNPMNTAITSEDLINNYEQLLNLCTAHINRLKLQLLQQKQMEISGMTDSPLLGNDNMFGSPMTPNPYNAMNVNGFPINNNTTNINNNLGFNPSLNMMNGFNTNPVSGNTTTPAMTNNAMLNLNLMANNSNTNTNNIIPSTTNPNLNNLNYMDSPNINYIPNINLNQGNNGNINSAQPNYYNNQLPLTNGLNLAINNGIATTAATIPSNINNLNTPDMNDLYQKRISWTNTNTNTNSLYVNENKNNNILTTSTTTMDTNNNTHPSNIVASSQNDNIIINGNGQAVNTTNTATVTNTTDSNDQSMNNAKNLFLEVIKDFNENDIQDIVQGSNVDYNTLEYY